MDYNISVNFSWRATIKGLLLKNAYHLFVSAFLPVAILLRYGVFSLGQVLPLLGLFYLLNYFIHFNLNERLQDNAGNEGYYESWVNAIKARTMYALLLFSCLLLMKIPFLLLGIGCLWVFLRFLNNSISSASMPAGGIHSTEWIVYSAALIFLISSPFTFTSTQLFQLLAAAELILFLFHCSRRNGNPIPLYFPRTDISEMRKEAAPFFIKTLYFLRNTILLIPALIYLPAMALSLYFVQLLWILGGIYFSYIILLPAVHHFSQSGAREIKGSIPLLLLRGSAFALCWAMGGYFLCRETSIQEPLNPELMIPVFGTLLLSFHNFPLEYLLARYGEAGKNNILNLILVMVQAVAGYLIIQSGQPSTSLWLITITTLLYGGGLRYFSARFS